ncbi:glycine/D-amino acid oxidase-like deaminating enzyme [Hoeflea marina]|uniref:Glycine/D-amino acid oxidase-like deaminating enzyme n=1 Tax=Hoeflea marina TaxID=274592 RepID=A0A317PQ93_9HYPH|nr:FAD-dependent oxidoreductase [Hoeflea marina]PWW01760.1 glycine/D-amino acid oxidase-like deaminating enzyme [Hoeflea marina]
MLAADRRAARAGQLTCDLLVVGGGIAGCWAALKGARAGLSTILLEKAEIGAGASGGFLGALMPHMPERWNGKKDFQFKALVSLQREIATLESRTGMECGYARTGRLIPLASDGARQAALARAADAEANWGSKYSFSVIDEPAGAGWPESAAMRHGAVFETLSARVQPRALLRMLLASMEDQSKARILTHELAPEIDPAGSARLTDGTLISFGHLVLANGVDAFPMIARLAGVPDAPLGAPVKGQAALLKTDLDPDMPLLYDDGLYVIAHEDGRAAIGSTSETEFDQPLSTDAQLDDLVARARVLCPALGDAGIVQRWAGLRPRAIGRDPMLGAIPGCDQVLVSAGGFKISFGIAHRMAEAVIGSITGQMTVEVPESFAVAAHLARARAAASGATPS